MHGHSAVSGESGRLTVTLKLQVFVWPQRSLAVTYTTLVPIGNTLPLGGVAVRTGALQPPVAERLKLTAAPLEPVAITFVFAGQVTMSGGGVSRKASYRLTPLDQH